MQSYKIKQRRVWMCYVVLLVIFACRSDRKAPDVSHIPMHVTVERMDSALFAIDTSSVAAGMPALARRWPVMFPVYVEHMLHFGPYSDTSSMATAGLHMFITNSDIRFLKDTVQKQFADLRPLEKELAQCFRYIKYYIPSFHPPKVVAFITGIANYGAVTADTVLGIGLDMYMGADFPPYALIPDYPAYLIRRFTPAYISVNCAQVIQQDLYPGVEEGSKLVDQLITAGKQQYFLEKVLPATADTIRLGYTKDQLDFCFDNERMIWQFFIQHNLLYNTDWQEAAHYMGDGPSTQGMPPGSPGRIGHFVGWRIVSAYMARHPNVTLQQLMEQKNLQEILTGAKYKP